MDNDGENQGFCQNVIPSISFRKLALSRRRELSHHIPCQAWLTSLPHIYQGLQDRRIHATGDPWALNQMQMWRTSTEALSAVLNPSACKGAAPKDSHSLLSGDCTSCRLICLSSLLCVCPSARSQSPNSQRKTVVKRLNLTSKFWRNS